MPNISGHEYVNFSDFEEPTEEQKKIYQILRDFSEKIEKMSSIVIHQSALPQVADGSFTFSHLPKRRPVASAV